MMVLLAAVAAYGSACDDAPIEPAAEAGADAEAGVPLDAGSDTGVISDGGIDGSESDAAIPIVSCSKTFGNGVDRLLSASVTVDPKGNILFTGALSGSADFGGGALTSAGGFDLFVVKLDNSCKHVWSKRFGDAELQGGANIVATPSGGSIVAGYFQGAIDMGKGALTTSGTSIVLASLDAAGTVQWSKRFGGAGQQLVYDLSIDSEGNILLAGAFNGDLDFGGGALSGPPPSDGGDIFLAKLDANGSHVWSRSFGPPAGGSVFASSIVTSASGVIYASGNGQGTIDFGLGPIVFPASNEGSGTWIARFSSAGTILSVEAFKNVVAASRLRVGSELVVAGGIHGDADLGTGPLVITKPDGSTTHPKTFISTFSADGKRASMLRSFGRADFTQILDFGFSGFLPSTTEIAVSGRCIGPVDIDGPCTPGSHKFLRFRLDGGLASRTDHPAGPIALTATQQFVVTGAQPPPGGSAETLTVTKFLP
ncbi:MAG: SBBP repeat-containing protein [Deltaproteobacteria bacterium]|nr:SBBP repeat-containing protein [Deltaproteobacteria bacterium]